MIDTLLAGLARLVTRRPRSILAGSLLLTAAALWAARDIELRADLTELLPVRGEASGALKDYLQHFRTADLLLISIGLPEGAAGDPEPLEEAGDRLVELLEGTGLFRSVACRVDEAAQERALRFALDHLPALAGPERAPALAARLSAPAMRDALRGLRGRLLSPASPAAEMLATEDPLGLLAFLPPIDPGTGSAFQVDASDGAFLSADRRALLVVGEPLHPPFDLEFSRRLMGAVHAAIRDLAAPGLEILVAGGHRIAVGDEATMRRDMTLTAFASLGGVLAVFWLVFRRPRVLALAAAPLALSACWSLGLAALSPGHLNLVTVGFAAILFGLGDDSALHLYGRFAEERGRGATVEEAVRAAIQGTGRAILAANLTTAMAFSLLAIAKFKALAELALLAQYGIGSLIVAMLVVMPALLVAAPGRWRAGEGSADDLRLRVPGLGALLGVALGRPRACIAAGAAAACLAAAFLPAVSFDFDLQRLRPANSPAVRDEQILHQRFSAATDTGYLILRATDTDGALAAAASLHPALKAALRRGEIQGFALPPAFLKPTAEQRRSVEALRGSGVLAGAAARLRRALEVERFRTGAFEPALRRLERWEKGGDLLFLPSGEEVESLLPAGMQTLRSEPGGVWLSVPVHFKAGSAAQISSIGLFREARAFGFRPALLSAAVRETQEQVAGSFRTLAIAAPLLVLAITWILLGRGSAALLALLPMGAGVLTALAVAGAASIPISTLTLIVTPLLFGLGVDYGIYMVHAWLEAGWRSGSAALGAAGRTVVAASSTTFTGFASLCLAEFRGLREIGVLTACGIAAAVLAAILVLPAALALRARGEERS